MDTKGRLPGDKVSACFFHCATLGMFFPLSGPPLSGPPLSDRTLRRCPFLVGTECCTKAEMRRRYQDRTISKGGRPWDVRNTWLVTPLFWFGAPNCHSDIIALKSFDSLAHLVPATPLRVHGSRCIFLSLGILLSHRMVAVFSWRSVFLIFLRMA